jgi:adenine phosphoribosyltransferase
MATLDSLKWALRQKATATASSPKQPLSDTQYSAGFDILARGSGWMTYQDFIIPQLSQLLAPLFNSRIHISALEIGPGPKSVFGYLPGRLRRKVRRYAAFEPNGLFATRLEEWLCSTSETESPLPCLESLPDIHRIPFVLDSNTGSGTGTGTSDGDEKFDVILFCHSMYGMKLKHRFIERALEMLVERPEGGMVVVFHRDGTLHLDGLICHRTASFPTGVIRVANDDEVLDCFAPFVAGFVMQDVDVDKAIRVEWRKVCRALGRREEAHPDHLLFSSPNVMAAFTQHATTLPELTAQVPLVKGDKTVKNREARLHRPASIIRPTEVRHVQQCVRWALKHGVGLTVVGGGHSGHCLWPNVVSVDMDAFDQVHILTAGEDGRKSGSDSGSLVVAEAGCKTGDIVRKTMAAGVTVPLGARPSVGAGQWLQGGIGHLARLHGLACDAIVGAVVVSVESSQALCVGRVPSQHRPAGAVRPENETDLLWAMKGAGTNFGIVVSVTFKAYAAPTYSIRNWVVPLSDNLEARLRLSDFDKLVARKLPRNCSADAYLYWDIDQLHLGVTMFESSTTRLTFETPTPTPTPVGTILGPEDNFKAVDGVGLFETEMYMSGMHGGHGGGKTSSFKRCLFLKRIGAVNVANILVAAVETRPSLLCYLHLLQGGGAVGDVAAEATAFGCRDWDFACVVTGVWPRDQDGTEAARAAVRWVYNVARDLLPLSSGAYGADLGPDPRDAALAAKAFGPNRLRLARLKHSSDPRNVLAYACPLPKAPMEQKLIILVTGESCAGKDYCADIWVSVFTTCTYKSLTARAVSISDAIKREYAAATGADLNRLLWDRAYKEQHRPALTTFFQGQVRQRPRLPEEHFLNVVYGAVDVDVLLITGMRDEAPVAALSHLVPDSRLLEIRVKASEETRRVRRRCHGGDDDGDDNKDNKDSNNGRSNLTALDYRPSLIFDNDTTGNEAAKRLAEHYLLPFFHEDLQRLANMVRPVPDFPRPGIEFRHVLDISQQPGGLALCTSLLQTHFTGDWAKVDVVACCEVGGFVYASALAARVDVPLALIREAGKLPPPTISVIKSPSHVSSSVSNDSREKRIEMDRDVVPRGASVVVVDDVLATGKTLCAVLQLLNEAGIGAEDVSIMAVAEFPVHCGRELLRRRGFGRVNIQSLLVFGGA